MFYSIQYKNLLNFDKNSVVTQENFFLKLSIYSQIERA